MDGCSVLLLVQFDRLDLPVGLAEVSASGLDVGGASGEACEGGAGLGLAEGGFLGGPVIPGPVAALK